MKKITSLFVLTLLSISFAFSQSNSTGGVNYYETISAYGKTLPSYGGSGTTALVFVDMAVINDGVVDGLTANGYSVTIAADAVDFSTQLQSGGFTLAVYFTQAFESDYYGNYTEIANFIAGGGEMLYTTYGELVDEPYANLFEASITTNTNLVTVTVSDPTIASGISNPFTLSDPGWYTFSVGLNAIGSGEVLATFENGDAAMIRGNGGRTIMLGYLSDATPAAENQAIFSNVESAVAGSPSVPIPFYWFIALFALIGISVIISKRKVIFS